MNKSDIKLIIGLILFSIIMIGFIIITKNDDKKIAKVYYENNLILMIPLEPEKKEIYTVQGYNGDVRIEVNNQRLRVIEEDSPLHLCSKQGFIKETYETIVCLPNKVVIEIEASTDLDAVVK
ncbi:MAG: NusG domain II-containing protein [Bacilli bacterium]|nr:NusG domain II-containing protein [Bacilli bacterium]MDD4719067.1 NusG domain II-containing protein [Bacilli bacterium]